MQKKFMHTPSPLGQLSLVASDIALCGVFFDVHAHHTHDPAWKKDQSHPLLLRAADQLAAYFRGELRHFDLPLDQSGGTAFQQEVWRALMSIPYGGRRSYGALAQQIGRPRAVRALGAANGRNPLSIIVPCHRVVASTGALHGYAGGLENKAFLLALEEGK